MRLFKQSAREMDRAEVGALYQRTTPKGYTPKVRPWWELWCLIWGIGALAGLAQEGVPHLERVGVSPEATIEGSGDGADSTAPLRLDLYFLVDRSPSALAQGRGERIDDAIATIVEILRQREATSSILQVGMANFGGRIGEFRRIANVEKVPFALLERERIDSTDFTVAFRHLHDMLSNEPCPSNCVQVGVLLTDARPAFAERPFAPIDLRQHLLGPGDDSIAAAYRHVRDIPAAVFLLAFDDDESDARLWQELLSEDRYLPVEESDQGSAAIAVLVRSLEGMLRATQRTEPVRHPTVTLTEGIAGEEVSPLPRKNRPSTKPVLVLVVGLLLLCVVKAYHWFQYGLALAPKTSTKTELALASRNDGGRLLPLLLLLCYGRLRGRRFQALVAFLERPDERRVAAFRNVCVRFPLAPYLIRLVLENLRRRDSNEIYWQYLRSCSETGGTTLPSVAATALVRSSGLVIDFCEMHRRGVESTASLVDLSATGWLKKAPASSKIYDLHRQVRDWWKDYEIRRKSMVDRAWTRAMAIGLRQAHKELAVHNARDPELDALTSYYGLLVQMVDWDRDGAPLEMKDVDSVVTDLSSPVSQLLLDIKGILEHVLGAELWKKPDELGSFIDRVQFRKIGDWVDSDHPARCLLMCALCLWMSAMKSTEGTAMVFLETPRLPRIAGRWWKVRGFFIAPDQKAQNITSFSCGGVGDGDGDNGMSFRETRPIRLNPAWRPKEEFAFEVTLSREGLEARTTAAIKLSAFNENDGEVPLLNGRKEIQLIDSTEKKSSSLDSPGSMLDALPEDENVLLVVLGESTETGALRAFPAHERDDILMIYAALKGIEHLRHWLRVDSIRVAMQVEAIGRSLFSNGVRIVQRNSLGLLRGRFPQVIFDPEALLNLVELAGGKVLSEEFCLFVQKFLEEWKCHYFGEEAMSALRVAMLEQSRSLLEEEWQGLELHDRNFLAGLSSDLDDDGRAPKSRFLRGGIGNGAALDARIDRVSQWCESDQSYFLCFTSPIRRQFVLERALSTMAAK